MSENERALRLALKVEAETGRLLDERDALKAALTAAEARIKMLSEAVADEVDRLRPHYVSGTATDIARRQMLDHFAAKFPRALTHGASDAG